MPAPMQRSVLSQMRAAVWANECHGAGQQVRSSRRRDGGMWRTTPRAGLVQGWCCWGTLCLALLVPPSSLHPQLQLQEYRHMEPNHVSLPQAWIPCQHSMWPGWGENHTNPPAVKLQQRSAARVIILTCDGVCLNDFHFVPQSAKCPTICSLVFATHQ